MSEEQSTNETHLTDEQMDVIAEKAATRAVEKMTKAAFEGIGRSVVSKFFTVIGILALTLYFWLTALGKIPPTIK